MCTLHTVIMLCFGCWQGLANCSMRIQDLYVEQFPIPRFISLFFKSYARAHVPVYPHTPTRIRTRTHTGSSSKRTEHSRGVSLQSVSTTWRNVWRCTPFLTTLGTHCISRSGPSSPTRSAYSPASPLSPWLPAPRHTHTQSRPSDRPLQHQGTTSTPTRAYSSGVCLFSSDGQGSVFCIL